MNDAVRTGRQMPVGGRTGTTVDLRQLPERHRLKVCFEVLEEFGHTSQSPDGRETAGPGGRVRPWTT